MAAWLRALELKSGGSGKNPPPPRGTDLMSVKRNIAVEII